MAAAGSAAVSDTEGQTTVEQRIVPAAPGAFRFLQLGEGEPYTVRQELAAAGAEPRRSAHLARLLRPALRLPARRRGVAGPARDHRPALDPAQPPLRRRLAALGGARAADRRRDDPPDRPVHGGQPGRRRQRRPPPDGLHDRHRRLRRQPAAQRDRMGADPARGRHAQPQQRRRQEQILEPALPEPVRPRRRRGRPLHRRAGLQRLLRGPLPGVLRPQQPGAARTPPGPNTRA